MLNSCSINKYIILKELMRDAMLRICFINCYIQMQNSNKFRIEMNSSSFIARVLCKPCIFRHASGTQRF